MKGMEVLFIIFIATSLDQATFHSYFPLLSWTLSSTGAQNDLLKTKRVCQTPVHYSLQPHASHRVKPGRVTRSHPSVSPLPSSFLLYAKYIFHLGALCTASYHSGAFFSQPATLSSTYEVLDEMHILNRTVLIVLFIITILLGTPSSNSLCKSLHRKVSANIFYWNMVD